MSTKTTTKAERKQARDMLAKAKKKKAASHAIGERKRYREVMKLREESFELLKLNAALLAALKAAWRHVEDNCSYPVELEKKVLSAIAATKE